MSHQVKEGWKSSKISTFSAFLVLISWVPKSWSTLIICVQSIKIRNNFYYYLIHIPRIWQKMTEICLSKLMSKTCDYSILEMLTILTKCWLFYLLFITVIILLRRTIILEMIRILLNCALFYILFVSFIFLLRGIESGQQLDGVPVILIIPIFWTVWVPVFVVMNCCIITVNTMR